MLELARDAGAGVLTCSCARPRKPPRDEAAEPLRDDRTAAEKQVDQHLENAAIRIQARSRGSHDRRVVGERIEALERSRAWSTASSFDEFVAANERSDLKVYRVEHERSSAPTRRNSSNKERT